MAIRRPTLREIRALMVAIGKEADGATRTITTSWVTAWDELAPAWREALDDVLAYQARTGEWPSNWELSRVQRLNDAMERSRQALIQLGNRAGVTVMDGAAQVVALDAQAEARIVSSQLPAADQATVAARFTANVSPQALDIIVARSQSQIVNMLRPLSTAALDAMRRELIRGIAVGTNPRQAAGRMVARVEGEFNGGLSRAITVARTEMLDAYRAASRYQQAANGDLLSGWIWLSQLTKRTCVACWSKHGTEYPLDMPGPLGHQQCLLPGTIVEGPRATASTARWYEGEVIDLQVDGGHYLSVTPNHPVLTPDGWVAAGDLREGSYVVCGGRGQRRPVGVDPNDYQIPALIEQVVQTLGGSTPVLAVSVPTSAEDFHGDGAGSKVHAVRTNSLLQGYVESTVGQPATELYLGGGDMALPPGSAGFTAESRLGLSFFGQRDAPGRGLCRQHQVAVFLDSSRTRHEGVGDLSRASGYPSVVQSAVDQSSRDAEAIREALAGLPREVSGDHDADWNGVGAQQRFAGVAGPQGPGLLQGSQQSSFDEDGAEPRLAGSVLSRSVLAAYAGEVVANRVVYVGRRSWSGHVYNLQTNQGWYVASGIVTHNCRCARAPKAKSWRDLGIDVDEPPDTIPNARAKFGALSDADQRAIMGPARLDLLKAGRIDWDDLPVERASPGWRMSYGPRPVGDLERIARQRES